VLSPSSDTLDWHSHNTTDNDDKQWKSRPVQLSTSSNLPTTLILPLPTRIHPIPLCYPPSKAATTQSTTSTPAPNERGPGHKQSIRHTGPFEPCLTPCSRCSRSSSTLARYHDNYTWFCRRFCTTSPSLARVGVGLVRCSSGSPWGRKSYNLTASSLDWMDCADALLILTSGCLLMLVGRMSYIGLMYCVGVKSDALLCLCNQW
jgi:hypothetical protein